MIWALFSANNSHLIPLFYVVLHGSVTHVLDLSQLGDHHIDIEYIIRMAPSGRRDICSRLGLFILAVTLHPRWYKEVHCFLGSSLLTGTHNRLTLFFKLRHRVLDLVEHFLYETDQRHIHSHSQSQGTEKLPSRPSRPVPSCPSSASPETHQSATHISGIQFTNRIWNGKTGKLLLVLIETLL